MKDRVSSNDLFGNCLNGINTEKLHSTKHMKSKRIGSWKIERIKKANMSNSSIISRNRQNGEPCSHPRVVDSLKRAKRSAHETGKYIATESMRFQKTGGGIALLSMVAMKNYEKLLSHKNSLGIFEDLQHCISPRVSEAAFCSGARQKKMSRTIPVLNSESKFLDRPFSGHNITHSTWSVEILDDIENKSDCFNSNPNPNSPGSSQLVGKKKFPKCNKKVDSTKSDCHECDGQINQSSVLDEWDYADDPGV